MARARQRGGREAEYRRLFARQARSGLSAREFAEREGIAVQTFYWWRCELRRRERAQPTRQDEPEFVEVSLNPSTPTAWVEGIDVQLPDGVLIRVPSGFDEDDLVRVLSVLRRSC